MTKESIWKNPVFRLMIFISVSLLVLTVIFVLLHQCYDQRWMLSVYVTTMTIAYHIIMRLVVGEAVTVALRNKHPDPDALAFRIYHFEKNLYNRLKVKTWKTNAITAKPEQFDLKQVNLKALLKNMLQAELVHRIIMVLSFVPLLLIIPYGVPMVFILTSVVACLIDMQFVIIQRYNRPRVVRMINRVKGGGSD